MYMNIQLEEFDLVEIDNVEVLFTNLRIDRKTVPSDLYCYDVRESEGFSDDPATIEEFVAVNHYGTILSKKPFPLKNGFYPLKDGINYLGETCTLDEFQKQVDSTDQKITVLLIEAGKNPQVIEIENSLEEFQRIVQGHIQYLPLFEDIDNACMLLNEEGKILNLDINMFYHGDYLVGNIIICGCCEDNFQSLSEQQIERFKHLFAV